jgi:hypothetical protein
MKRLASISVLILLLVLPATAPATYVSFDFTFRFDDSGGSDYFLECIDVHTGEILLKKSPIAANTEYTLTVPKADHDRIICIVKVFGGPTVGLWRIFPKQYYQGCGGDVSSSLPNDTGTCGDGVISGPEKCDTGGNVGCSPSSANPRCCSCDYCGCASDKDCPQVTGAQCGYGRCAPTERPVFSVSCYYCGTCIYGYRCVADPACAGADNPVETAEAAFNIDREAVHGALPPGQTAVYFPRGVPVQVTYAAPSLIVNGELIPGPLEPGSVSILSDGTWVGILEADPAAARFYLMDPRVLEVVATEWRNSLNAVDMTGVENMAALKGFLRNVLRRVPGPLPMEMINLTVAGDGKYRARSALRNVSRVREGSFCAPTLTVRTDLETLEAIFEEKLTVTEAASRGLLIIRRR